MVAQSMLRTYEEKYGFPKKKLDLTTLSMLSIAVDKSNYLITSYIHTVF